MRHRFKKRIFTRGATIESAMAHGRNSLVTSVVGKSNLRFGSCVKRTRMRLIAVRPNSERGLFEAKAKRNISPMVANWASFI